jgi:methylmalonyl-CoA mutase
MSENTAGMELLQLSQEFPPVPTSDWESVIQKDLKGADYEKKLVWKTEEGISVLPYYRSENLKPFETLVDLAPGQFPFTRAGCAGWEEAQAWTAPKGAVRGDYLHEAGATAVQELGFALAEAVENLNAAIESGKSVDAAAPSIAFVFAAGSNYFFEIAKLRAARLLWSTAVAAFGPDDSKAAITRIHVRTARENKSLHDPYTNLLRITTEGLSAVLGGCDSLTVEPFGFDDHLALNVQRILREEAHVGKVCDPAGGSYYIESLTEALAQETWKLFQQVEAAGGWTVALQSGMVEQALTTSREAKAKAVGSRRRVLVGVNNYPDTRELQAAGAPPAPLAQDRFPQARLAEPFEAIRDRTLRHTQKTGHRPKLVLLKRGDVKMKMARANFCLNFFGCAGFEIVESEDYANSDADIVVLCSSDPEYVAFAQDVCPKLKVPVLVAGNPKDQIDQLRSLGVKDFVHIQSNAVETLTRWQDALGLKPLAKE